MYLFKWRAHQGGWREPDRARYSNHNDDLDLDIHVDLNLDLDVHLDLNLDLDVNFDA